MIDKLQPGEVIKLSRELDAMEKVAEDRVDAVNMGRYMAQEFAKVSTVIFDHIDSTVEALPKFKQGLSKLSTHQALMTLFSTKDPGEADFDKLSSASHFYDTGSQVLAKLMSITIK